jgi:uracil-DNA glycosylase
LSKYPGAVEFVPLHPTLPQLQEALQHCRGCDLYRHATQAVAGEGRNSARVVLVGEQPGDREDLAGRPFVGPAGGLLDRALQEAGIDRDDVYVTNAVKHFKFEERGRFIESALARFVMATVHPSAILRAPDAVRRRTDYEAFVRDLAKVARAVRHQPSPRRLASR